MIQKILYATDLGAYTSHSLCHVEALAKQFNARVSVVHAVPSVDDFTAAVVNSYCSDRVKEELLTTSSIAGLIDALRDQIFDTLAGDQMGDDGLLNFIEDIIVLAGQPAPIILQQAERLNSDMIVIGSHGIDALDGRMLGSVAAKVLQLAKAPVLMVPMMNPHEAYGRSRSQSESSFRYR